MRFDFARAHVEMATPAYEALPAWIHTLVRATGRKAYHAAQGPNLDTIWPTTDLRADFERHRSDTLAEASATVYNFGHWSPKGDLQAGGVYWKFANYCDQILRARLGLVRESAPRGISWAICEGMLRVCFSTRDSRSWREVGYATEPALERARAVAVPNTLVSRIGTCHEDFASYVASIRAAIGDDGSAKWIDIAERFTIDD